MQNISPVDWTVDRSSLTETGYTRATNDLYRVPIEANPNDGTVVIGDVARDDSDDGVDGAGQTDAQVNALIDTRIPVVSTSY